MKRILTYGTYDLLHYGHIRLLKRAKALGDYLSDYCEVLYLDRTEGVSTTKIKEDLKLNEPNKDEKILPEPQN